MYICIKGELSFRKDARESEEFMLEVFNTVCEKRLFGVQLKPEQKQAVVELLKGNDVFAVLPTGFGKTLIFQTFVFSKAEASQSNVQPTVIVVVPL